MSRVFVFIFCCVISFSFGQRMTNRKMNRLMKLESFDKAIDYGMIKLQGLEKNQKRYLKKSTPYLLGLGLIYEKMGNYRESERYFRKSYENYLKKEELGKRIKASDLDALDEIADLYIYTGNYLEAENIIHESLALRKKKFGRNNPVRYRTYLPYGNLLMKKEEYDSAYYFLKKYVTYIRNSNHTSVTEISRYANTYSTLVDLEIKRGNFDDALYLSKKNLRLQHHFWTIKEAGKNNWRRIEAANKLSTCQRLNGRSDLALRKAEIALYRYNKKIGTDSDLLVDILLNISSIYFDQGKKDLGEEYLFKACELQQRLIDQNFKYLSEYEKENSFHKATITFSQLNSYLLSELKKDQKLNDELVRQAFTYRINNRGLILNASNKILNSILNSKDTAVTAMYEHLILLKNEVANKISSQDKDQRDQIVEKLRLEINQLEKDLGDKTGLVTDEQNIDFRDIAKELKDDECVIEIVRTTEFSHCTQCAQDSVFEYYFYYVEKDQEVPSLHYIGEGVEMENSELGFYFNTYYLDYESTHPYDVYWKKINSVIGDKQKVFLSPDGVYNLINIPILNSSEINGYVIDNKDVIYLTSPVEVLISKDKHQYKDAFLLGRPNFGSHMKDSTAHNIIDKSISRFGNGFRDGISDLPGTEVEVRKISDILTEKKIKNSLLFWDEATEYNLKHIKAPSILHLATHGFFDAGDASVNPMLRSGLLLADLAYIDALDDGVLTAYEASCLDLKGTELVVLSACESGLGEMKNGEGVYGLQRAFKVAGVNNIVISSWKVDDAATALLMIYFYQSLQEDKSLYLAFKEAQLKLRKVYPEPYFWGAFKIIGE